MAFKTKTEPYGIADGTTLVVLSTTDGKTASNAEALGEDGSIVANTVYGETSAPTAELALKADWETDDGDIQLGAVTTSDNKKFALGGIHIRTAAGAAPTISIKGEQVQSDAASRCVYEVPGFSLTTKHHAQPLFGAFSLSGTGCHLQGADYDITGAIGKATKDGDCLTFDITQGKIEVSVSVKQTGTTAPTLAAGTGFQIVDPLAESNPDAEYPTFSAKLVKYLTKTDAST
jgi:hypothetical protein